MANTSVIFSGVNGPVKVKATDEGAGVFSLATATSTFGGTDTLIIAPSDNSSSPVLIRAYDLNDGSGYYAIGVSS